MKKVRFVSIVLIVVLMFGGIASANLLLDNEYEDGISSNANVFKNFNGFNVGVDFSARGEDCEIKDGEVDGSHWFMKYGKYPMTANAPWVGVFTTDTVTFDTSAQVQVYSKFVAKIGRITRPAALRQRTNNGEIRIELTDNNGANIELVAKQKVDALGFYKADGENTAWQLQYNPDGSEGINSSTWPSEVPAVAAEEIYYSYEIAMFGMEDEEDSNKYLVHYEIYNYVVGTIQHDYPKVNPGQFSGEFSINKANWSGKTKLRVKFVIGPSLIGVRSTSFPGAPAGWIHRYVNVAFDHDQNRSYQDWVNIDWLRKDTPTAPLPNVDMETSETPGGGGGNPADIFPEAPYGSWNIIEWIRWLYDVFVWFITWPIRAAAPYLTVQAANLLSIQSAVGNFIAFIYAVWASIPTLIRIMIGAALIWLLMQKFVLARFNMDS